MNERPDMQLIPATVNDAAEIYRAIDENRRSLRTWLPFIDHSKSSEGTELFLRSTEHTGEMVYIIRYQNKFAGLIGLKNIDRTNKKLEIGYWLIPSCEGRGLVTWACREMIEYAFDVLEVNRVLIQAAVGNQRSRRIPERLGFHEEGIERDGELLASGYTDIVRYGLLKREYNGNN